jgi:hypothetical protein
VYSPTPEQAKAEKELREEADGKEAEERSLAERRERIRALVNRCDELGIPRSRIAEAAKVQRSQLYAELLSSE